MTESGLVPLEEVRAEILSVCPPLDSVTLELGSALGCVVADAILATEDVPPFANTAMDGFAVRAADTRDAPVELEISGTVAAGGAPACQVRPGQAARIMTGAPMPTGADAVVIIERTSPSPDGATVLIQSPAAPGDHIRLAGDDLRAGQMVVDARTVLGPAHLGLLSCVGLGAVRVFPAARVGVLSTGDELVGPGAALGPGQIRDANRPALLGLVSQTSCVAIDLGSVPDDEGQITDRVSQGLEQCDALLLSGGVSVGDFDYVKAVIDRLEQSWWWQVAVRPAKPLAFGVRAGKPVFGLPGNPVSSIVSFELFARPALRQMMGHTDIFRPEVDTIADEQLRRRPDGKLHLMRAVAQLGDDGRFHVRSAGGQASHILSAMAEANALALLPDGEGVQEGAVVKAMILT